MQKNFLKFIFFNQIFIILYGFFFLHSTFSFSSFVLYFFIYTSIILSNFLSFKGGRHIAQYIAKHRKGVACAECKVALPGIKHMEKNGFKNGKQADKKVSRAYGGNQCHKCVRDRIVRAFLIEEQKLSKKVLLEKSKKAKKTA